MTWLLAQTEHLPLLLGMIVVNYVIGRIVFASRGDVQALAEKNSKLEQDDDRHMSSVGNAHKRIDEFTREITSRVDDWNMSCHKDFCRLFELAHDHEHRKDGDVEIT